MIAQNYWIFSNKFIEAGREGIFYCVHIDKYHLFQKQ